MTTQTTDAGRVGLATLLLATATAVAAQDPFALPAELHENRRDRRKTLICRSGLLPVDADFWHLQARSR